MLCRFRSQILISDLVLSAASFISPRLFTCHTRCWLFLLFVLSASRSIGPTQTESRSIAFSFNCFFHSYLIVSFRRSSISGARYAFTLWEEWLVGCWHSFLVNLSLSVSRAEMIVVLLLCFFNPLRCHNPTVTDGFFFFLCLIRRWRRTSIGRVYESLTTTSARISPKRIGILFEFSFYLDCFITLSFVIVEHLPYRFRLSVHSRVECV